MPLNLVWGIWGIDHLPRKPVPAFDHWLSKEMIPNVQSEYPWHNFEQFPCVSGYQGNKISIILSTFPPKEAVGSNDIAPQQ